MSTGAETNPISPLAELRAAVHLLALGPVEQQALYPEMGEYPLGDDLVGDFEASLIASKRGGLLSTEALEALGALDQLLEQLAGPAFESMYLTPAGVLDSRWDAIRVEARRVASLMGWTNAPSPPRDTIYFA